MAKGEFVFCGTCVRAEGNGARCRIDGQTFMHFQQALCPKDWVDRCRRLSQDGLQGNADELMRWETRSFHQDQIK